jgi:uncharacterized protein (DUF3820 family)
MNYEKFPFGKYKGHLLSNLPNTYIVYALEEFTLPEDLKNQLQEILIENLGIESQLAVSVETIEKVYEDMMSFFAGKRESPHIYEALNEFKEALLMSL